MEEQTSRSVEGGAARQSLLERSFSFRMTVSWLLLAGLGGIYTGLAYFFHTQGFTRLGIADAGFNLVAGALILACSQILKRGNSLVIWLFSGTLIFMLAYGFAVGRGFNALFGIVGAILLWQMAAFRRRGELF
jgi:hypothetical protein